MLFLIDAYLYGIKGAEEEIIWRCSLDYKMGATSYECINTKSGEPWKPNYGLQCSDILILEATGK